MSRPLREPDQRQHFEELFRAHSRAVLAYALRRATGPADASDVVAEVMLIAWRRIDVVPDEPETRSWLLGVARNVLANQARGEGRRWRLGRRLRGQVCEAWTPPTSGPEGDSPIVAALARLPEADREILTLIAWDDLTPSEAASMLSIHPAAARTRLHRARARLRTELGPDFGGIAPRTNVAEEEA